MTTAYQYGEVPQNDAPPYYQPGAAEQLPPQYQYAYQAQPVQPAFAQPFLPTPATYWLDRPVCLSCTKCSNGLLVFFVVWIVLAGIGNLVNSPIGCKQPSECCSVDGGATSSWTDVYCTQCTETAGCSYQSLCNSNPQWDSCCFGEACNNVPYMSLFEVCNTGSTSGQGFTDIPMAYCTGAVVSGIIIGLAAFSMFITMLVFCCRSCCGCCRPQQGVYLIQR